MCSCTDIDMDIFFFGILVFFSSIHFPHLIFRTRLEQGIEQLKSKLQEAK